MTHELVLTNAAVVLADELVHGTVVLRGGRIAEVSAGRSRLPGALDLEGDHLLPGLVELHTDNLEQHLIPRPRVRWPGIGAVLSHDAAMATAGITTVFDAVACGCDHAKEYRRDLCDIAVAAVTEAREQRLLRADHLLHLRCEIVAEDMPEQFERHLGNPLVALASIVDHTPGDRQFVDLEGFRRHYLGKHVERRELEELIRRRQRAQRELGASHRALVAERCRQRRITLASHDDASAGHVAEAAAMGASICEFPTTLEAAQAAHRRGLKTVMGAPNIVRGGSHSGNVAAGELARRGLLDILSSDYVPASLIAAIWRLHEALEMPLPRAVGCASREPARRLGLTDRGEIAPGLRGDLVQVGRSRHGPIIRRVWAGGARIA